MTDKPEDPNEALEQLFQRTPDTERESANVLPASLEETTDTDFWGFADTFRSIPRLHRQEDVTPSSRDRLLENRPVSLTPPRVVIPPALHRWGSDELTPLPRVWATGDRVLVVLLALTTIAVALLLLVK